MRRMMVIPVSLLACAFVAGCACAGGGGQARHEDPCDPCDEQKVASRSEELTPVSSNCGPTQAEVRVDFDLPHKASPGECFAQVFVPPKLETRTESICLRPASERIEVVPAQYEWVEERVMVKDASTELQPVAAKFESDEKSIEVQCAHTGWSRDVAINCKFENSDSKSESPRDVICLVSNPAVTKTVRTQRMTQAAAVEKKAVAAEYQTIRRQKLVCDATTRKVQIPAEYDTIEKTIVVAPGRLEWQRVLCEIKTTPETANAVKSALTAHGYDTGPLNGQLGAKDWKALKDYQEDHDLATGGLTYATLRDLGVSAK